MHLDLAREAIAARELLAAVRAGGEIVAEDEQLVLASETNLHEALAEAAGDLAELEALVIGITAIENDLSARKARFQARQESIREAIKAAFERADLHSPVVLPNATLSIGRGPRKVHVVDASKIPLEFMRVPPPEPNLRAIGLEWRDGRPVPGTTQGNAQPVLTIRRS